MIAIVKGYCKEDVLELAWGPEKVSILYIVTVQCFYPSCQIKSGLCSIYDKT